MKTLFVAAAVLFAMLAQATQNLSNKPTRNMDCSAGTCIATDANAVLNVDDLAAMHAAGNVRVALAALPEGFQPSVWGQNPKINNGLPYLLTNPPR
jgi:hypothetical protein